MLGSSHRRSSTAQEKQPPRKAAAVVIIGAGFSGTSVAIELLRQRFRAPLEIFLVDRAQIARGLAYSRLGLSYLLNVPAGRMSANPADPSEFLEFIRRHSPAVSAEDFVPREWYGEYLGASLDRAEREAQDCVTLHRVYGMAIALEHVHRSHLIDVHLADGRRLRADHVVLALGNPPPRVLPGSELLQNDERYVSDPWQRASRFQAGESVLIVGTGLTMADVVLAGHPGPRRAVTIHAISTHGLIPRSQRPLGPALPESDRRALLRAASTSLRHLVRTVRELAASSAEHGGDWREIITAVREVAPTIRRMLPEPERRRFLRHVRHYWDVHRHRLPQALATQLEALQTAGQLKIHAGRIVSLTPAGKRVQVRFRARGQRQISQFLVDRVVNCTGPDHDVSRTPERLLRALLAQGDAARDALGLGLVTDEADRLIGIQGRTAPNLYYVGPMLRGKEWEVTAVGELRTHTARLARHLAEVLEQDAHMSSPAAMLPIPGRAQVEATSGVEFR